MDRNHPRSKMNRCARWLGAMLGIVVVLSGGLATGLYLARERIAALVAQKYLARHGIESTIEFTTLGWGEFVARVRAGSSEAPEFTAEGVQVSLAYPGEGAAAMMTPVIRRIRLMRPTLRASFDGARISFGALQPLVDDLLAQPATSPKPDIVVESGTLLLKSPNGPIALNADATISGGAIRNLDARMQPTVLRRSDFAAQFDGGSIVANNAGDFLKVRTAFNIAAVSFRRRSAKDVVLQAAGEIRWKIGSGSFAATIAALKGSVRAGEWDAGFSRGLGSSAEFELRDIAATLQGREFSVTGRGEIVSRSAGVHYLEAEAANITSKESLSAFAMEISPSGWKMTSDGHAAGQGSGIAYPVGGGVSLTSAQVELDGSLAAGSEDLQANFRGALMANGALPRHQLTLRRLRVSVDGSLSVNRAHSSFTFRTSLSTNAQLPAATALAFARAIPGTDENIASSLASAMGSARVRSGQLTIRRNKNGLFIETREPIVILGANGARIALQPFGSRALADTHNGQIAGGFLFDAGGGTLPQLHLEVPDYHYAVVNGRLDATAQIHIQTAVDYGPLRKLSMIAAGRAKLSAGDFSFALDGCSDAAFDAFAPAGNSFITNAKMRFCGTAQHPEIVAGKSGWNVSGHVRLTSATFPAAGAAAADADGDIQLAGNGAEITNGLLSLAHATLSDLAKDPRFRPLSVSGTLKATGADWQGSLKVKMQNHDLANVALSHSLKSGAGEAEIDARNLIFQPNSFQPENIAPFLATFGSRVRGRADFTGHVAWSTNGMGPGSGRLVLRDVDFQSPAGMARQTNADIAFDSLLPIALHRSQTISIGRVETIVPLENIAATFSYTPDGLKLEHADANVAGGRASLDGIEYKFVPNTTTAGTLRLQNIDPMPLITAAGLENRIRVTARIDGEIPFTAGSGGLRFANGRIAAKGPGRLAVKREALTASVGVGAGAAAPPNAVQDFAYQALENLAFEQLDGTVNSRPMGRISVLLHVKGQHDPAVAGEPRVGIIDLLRGHAFDKPLPLPKGTPIDLTLDTSLNLDELLNSWFGGFRENAVSGRAPN